MVKKSDKETKKETKKEDKKVSFKEEGNRKEREEKDSKTLTRVEKQEKTKPKSAADGFFSKAFKMVRDLKTDSNGNINIKGNLVIGSGNYTEVDSDNDDCTLVIGPNTIRVGSLVLSIKKGLESCIEKKIGVYHCIADKEGGVFKINNNTITIHKNGEWSIDLRDSNARMDLNNPHQIHVDKHVFRFSKQGSDLKNVIRQLNTHGNASLFQFNL